MKDQDKTRWDLFLLLSLLLVILMFPVLDTGDVKRFFLGALVFVPAILATVKLSRMEVWMWPSVLLVSSAVICHVASTVFPGRALGVGKWGLLAMFFGLTVARLFNYLRNATYISDAHLFTAVSIYLMIGILWFTLYSAIDLAYPDSFLATNSVVSDHQTQLLYFSLVTLSTIGYGDIVPLRGEVRMLATLEGITGVLYIAIMMALLVSAYRPQKKQE